ncbi:MAG: leucyl/phenylalanyl-tRNA--protein transferase [Deltaproteobacteria bacterium]|nr:leucyl/phenylalanyl-tRNA--protein transferase [Deltaproteobacteria bacterium]
MPVFRLPEVPFFPDPELADPCGLLAVGGDLSPGRLLAAYLAGVFPCYGPSDPILWWSPDPRLVLFPDDLHIPRSLRRVLNGRRFRVTMNEAFGRVIRFCAGVSRPGSDGVWLVPEMIEAYEKLHGLGLAVSVEAWDDEGLAGGFYGVALGRAFFGESMFHLRPESSKAALATFVRHFAARIDFVDCQQKTEHMVRLGGGEVDRRRFRRRLAAAVGDFDDPETIRFWSGSRVIDPRTGEDT